MVHNVALWFTEGVANKIGRITNAASVSMRAGLSADTRRVDERQPRNGEGTEEHEARSHAAPPSYSMSRSLVPP